MQSVGVGLVSLAPVLNTLALLIGLGGVWLLLATRWREQMAATTQRSARAAGSAGNAEQSQAAQRLAIQRLATQRINRFFYGFGFASLALSWLLSTRLASF